VFGVQRRDFHPGTVRSIDSFGRYDQALQWRVGIIGPRTSASLRAAPELGRAADGVAPARRRFRAAVPASRRGATAVACSANSHRDAGGTASARGIPGASGTDRDRDSSVGRIGKAGVWTGPTSAGPRASAIQCAAGCAFRCRTVGSAICTVRRPSAARTSPRSRASRSCHTAHRSTPGGR
jgi:hypothetical protein